jgi:hypothetical protein
MERSRILPGRQVRRPKGITEERESRICRVCNDDANSPNCESAERSRLLFPPKSPTRKECEHERATR